MGTQRTILITGCSSGIGLDAAQTLKKDGWRVFASCRKEEDCRRLKSEGFESPLIDYSKSETIESGLKEVLDATGGTLDALFNNGAYGVGGAAEDVPTGLLREIFECNFFGWVDLTNRCIKIFRNQGNVGRVVQCSSILGNVVFPMRMAYSSTKFALEAYCDALRLELKDQPGIKIVSLNVGPIRTMIREKSVPHFDKWMKPLVPSSAFRSFYEKKFMPRLYGPYKKDPFELEPEAVTRKLKLALTCDATEAEVRGDCPDARVHVPEARAAGIRAGLDLPVRDRAVEAG
jgi:NAD(P)-dependent dehydrogenase (short-subunit alcohol dehydrogenase family)